MQYEAKIEVPKEELALMDKYCDAHPGEYPEVVRRHGGHLFNDEVDFPNGMIMEVSVCAPCDIDSAAWAEASLLARSTEREGSFIEVALTECEPELSGRWELEYKGNVYVVDVVGAS